ncbi:glycosyltransferase 87 family protein [Naasia lichenicola]|uniref:glycosyltransferase 87 family protein n=1 Tax=Naasia lichenicola TaxID=2565933 RepID=UPI00130DF82A|nr:glycosyltransferase 87 family protein [Naasia lichenicola]
MWTAFVLVHLVLGAIDLTDSTHLPFGDVLFVYRFWMDYAAQHGVIVGIDTAWVYPIAALLPMAASAVFGSALYGFTWLVIVSVLDAVALFVLARHRPIAAWWWVGFLAALGPVAVGRIDAVTAPLAILGVIWLSRRPVVAAALLALAAWMKVWPVAILLAAVIALRDRSRVVVGACATTIVVIGGALLAGSGANVFSFLLQQTGRGLQLEAPVSMYWVWDSVLRTGWSRIYYDRDILTWQVAGPGTGLVATLMTPLLVLAVLGMIALGVRATLRGAPGLDLLPPLALGLVLALIVTNKVGSPQFVGWLAAPFILWLLRGASPLRGPGVPLLAIAALTQAVYPWLYTGLVAADPIVAALLTARNAAYIALLAWTVRAIWRLGAADSGVRGRRSEVTDDVHIPEDAAPLPGVTTRES